VPDSCEAVALQAGGDGMIVLETTEEGAVVRLSTDELCMLNAALNEVCNGVHELGDDGELQTRTGYERAELQRLLDEIHPLGSAFI
jgi:hypothetical protein